VVADAVRARTRLVAGLLRPLLLSAGPETARVALVPTGALLLGGDVVTVDLAVGPHARVEVVETAGTVAYPGSPAAWHVRARLDVGAVVVWEGLPFVVCEGAEVRRSTVIEMASGARAVVRETLVLGRAGEHGGTLRQATRVSLAGAELLVEDLDLHAARRRAPGVLGEDRVLDTVSAFGFRPPDHPGTEVRGRLDLAGPGALQRYIGAESHLSHLGVVTARWRGAALSAFPGSDQDVDLSSAQERGREPAVVP
jgi:urease accessory protein